jgi:hypothetical protein
MMYWEVSAKTGHKVQELIDNLFAATLTGQNPGIVSPAMHSIRGHIDVTIRGLTHDIPTGPAKNSPKSQAGAKGVTQKGPRRP